MHDPKTIAETYLAAWNQADTGARLAQIARTWTPEARYADPLMEASGPEAICAMIEQARGQVPGLAFTLCGQPDGHREFVRFSWDLSPPGGAPVASGVDVLRLDAQGRIAGVVGFLDGAPA